MTIANYLGIALLIAVVLACLTIILVNYWFGRALRCRKCGRLFKPTKQEAILHFIDGAELYPFCPECDQPYDKQRNYRSSHGR